MSKCRPSDNGGSLLPVILSLVSTLDLLFEENYSMGSTSELPQTPTWCAEDPIQKLDLKTVPIKISDMAKGRVVCVFKS